MLGVDQSVLLLKKGNDIEKSLVFEELEKYNTKTRWNRRWYGGRSSGYSDFESSGAVVLTNAKEEFRKYKLLFFIRFIKKNQKYLVFVKTVLPTWKNILHL